MPITPMEMGSLNSLYSGACHAECSGEGPPASPAAELWGADSHAHTSTVKTNYGARPSGELLNILHGAPLLNTAERDAKPPYS